MKIELPYISYLTEEHYKQLYAWARKGVPTICSIEGPRSAVDEGVGPMDGYWMWDVRSVIKMPFRTEARRYKTFITDMDENVKDIWKDYFGSHVPPASEASSHSGYTKGDVIVLRLATDFPPIEAEQFMRKKDPVFWMMGSAKIEKYLNIRDGITPETDEVFGDILKDL